ncbi:MAG TPA: dihydrofolate reductase family protein [Streptosporangiaceae bacterium]|nr:dihydrofolate reductase family protein [Streptosporangiaceae bacterium]
MAKTQYLVAASIDGFIADSDNSLDWLFEAEARATQDAQAAREERFREFFAAAGAMTMGATTYEWVVEHEDVLTNSARWREYYGQVPCWVFTRRKLPLVPGANINFVSGDVGPVYDMMMAAAEGRNLWVVGGGELAGKFADLGLLDEIILSVAPVTLGAGAPLLPRRLSAAQLTLTDCSHDGTFVSFTYTFTRNALGD